MVRLSVYDACGRQVAELVAGRQAAGRHRIVWDAGRAPAGTYLLVLETESGKRRVTTLVKL
jgi:hypothetical protein